METKLVFILEEENDSTPGRGRSGVVDGSSITDTTTAPAASSVRLRRMAPLLDRCVLILILNVGFVSIIIILLNFSSSFAVK